MNHNCSILVTGLYAPLTSVPEPTNECVSTILLAPSGGGCVRAPSYDRKRAGTHPHHSSPRRQRGMRFESPLSISLVCVACPRSSSEPLCQAISTVDVLKTRVRKPVVGSMLVDSAVRLLEWKGVVGAFISMVLLCCDSAMHRSSFFWPEKAPLLTHNVYGAINEALL